MIYSLAILSEWRGLCMYNFSGLWEKFVCYRQVYTWNKVAWLFFQLPVMECVDHPGNSDSRCASPQCELFVILDEVGVPNNAGILKIWPDKSEVES